MLYAYPHVVEDGQDVSDGATVDILEVMVAPLRKDQSVALLLIKNEPTASAFHCFLPG